MVKDKFPLKDGFNEDVNNDYYHSNRQYKSSSALKLILKDPRQYYKTYVLNEPSSISSDALSIGSYVHTRILEPHLVDEEYAIYTSRKQGKAWEDFKEENEGKTILSSSQKSLSDSMIAEFEKATIKIGNADNEKEVFIKSFFEGGVPEETLCGKLDGYPIKVRFDYRKEFEDFGSINDLKTTGSPMSNREEVEEICAYWDYDLSAALYVDMVTKATGKPHDFYFVFISKKNYETKIFKASETMLERGRDKYKKAIELLKKAESSGIYFDNRIEELG
jgi:exodeoxyribonuclease VIII